jgi:hypothetical protein
MLAAIGGDGGSTKLLEAMLKQHIDSTNFITNLLIILILGSFAFTGFSFVYTWTTSSNIWKKLDEIIGNHILHIHERLDAIENPEKGKK